VTQVAHTRSECTCRTPQITETDRAIAARAYERAALERSEDELFSERTRFLRMQAAFHRIFGAGGVER
jgi:hypothetical protein